MEPHLPTKSSHARDQIQTRKASNPISLTLQNFTHGVLALGQSGDTFLFAVCFWQARLLSDAGLEIILKSPLGSCVKLKGTPFIQVCLY